MKKFSLLFLALFTSSVFAAMPTTEEELNAYIKAVILNQAKPDVISVMQAHMISSTVKIKTLELTRNDGAPLFFSPHAYNAATGQYTPPAHTLLVLKPQPGGHPAFMTGNGSESVNASWGFTEHTRPTGVQWVGFELNSNKEKPVALIMNPKQVSLPYADRGAFSITAERNWLTVRNEYKSHDILGYIGVLTSLNQSLGWLIGSPQ